MTAYLYDPDTDENFALEPEYDALLAEWANLNPDYPDPRIGNDPAFSFARLWAATMKKPARRRK